MAGPPSATASGLRSVAVGGNVTNSVIVTGDDANVQVRVDGSDALLAKLLAQSQLPRKTPRPRPLRDFPPPSGQHLNRTTERDALLAGVEAGRPVRVCGEADVGKTMTVTHALGGELAHRLADGCVYVFAKGKLYGDLLQEIFDAFVDCQPPYVAREQEIRSELRDGQALVVLDSAELSRDELRQLEMALPNCRFIIVSREPALGEGTPLKIEGLGTADGLLLVEQELGRALREDEVGHAEAVCIALAGHPFKLRQAAAGVREGEHSFEALAQELAKGEAGPTLAQLVLGSLSEEELALVRQLAALRGETVGVEHTVALLGNESVAGRLGDLQRRRVIASASPRYRIAGALNDLPDSPDGPGAAATGWGGPSDAERDRAISYFTSWARRHRAEPALVLSEAPALVQLMRDAQAHGRSKEVIGLGRSIDAAFAWGRRWGIWSVLLTMVSKEAHASGDLEAQAWADHQLGTREYCLGNSPGAVSLLTEALATRERIGDDDGAAATRHNLDFIANPPGGDREDRTDGNGGPRGPRRPLMALGVLAGILLVLAVATLAGGDDDPPVNSGDGDTAVDNREEEDDDGGASVGEGDEGGGGDGGGGRSILTVKVSGSGRIISEPAGIDCTDSCEGMFSSGSGVTLTARGLDGSTFGGWSGACSGTATCKLTIDDAASVSARFTAPYTPTECEDKKDNDDDGLIDGHDDPGCKADDTEASEPETECEDRQDNDLDGRIDGRDRDCVRRDPPPPVTPVPDTTTAPPPPPPPAPK